MDMTKPHDREVGVSGTFDLRSVRSAAVARLLQVIPIPTLLVDRSGEIVFASRTIAKIAEDYEQLVGSPFRSLFVDNSEAREAEDLLQRIFLERRPKMLEGVFLFRDHRIWGRMHLRSIVMREQRLVLVTVENLTAEKKRLLMNEKYKRLVHLIPIGIGEFSIATPVPLDQEAAAIMEAVLAARAVEGNEEFVRMQGLSGPGKLLSLKFGDLVPREGQNKILYSDWERNRFQLASAETNERSPGGDMRYVESTLIGMTRHQHLHGFWLLKRDTTDRQKMLQNALRTEKLESLGLLAGGLAHDFNNILTAILGNINLAKMFSSPGEKVYERLVEAERGSWRAKGLTEQLLTFSKGGAPVKKIGSIVSLLRESAEFALTGSNVRLELSVVEDLWPVEIDEGQIAQVINNLVINADQAMPDGGLISIAAENVVVDPEREIQLSAGRYVKVSVTDEGVGIPLEHMQRIFDPYFTTKQKGSGLGLATSYSIVKAHGGLIDVQSKLSLGTTFRVYLPATEKAVVVEQTQDHVPLDGKGRVLIVDDEEMVLDVASQMLRHMGYDVEEARDGAEAVALYKLALGSHRPFAAVIIDLTIPGGMGGQEAVRELLKVDPEARAVVSSGYSNDPIMGNFESFGFKGVVSKPYKVDELNAVLRRVTNNPGT